VNLLMISGDKSIAQGSLGVFYHMLQEYSKHWERIDVIVPKGKNTVETQLHDNVFVHPSSKGKLQQPLFIHRKGLDVWRQLPFDVISVHSYPPFYNEIGAWLLSRATDVPYILEVMHVIGYPRAADLDERWRRVATGLFYRFCWRGALAIRVINHQEVPGFLQRCGVPADKIMPLPCFYIDFDVFRPLGKIRTGRRIIYSGRLAKNKGLMELLAAFKLVLAGMPDAELIILGDGEMRPRLEALVARDGLERRVVFRGMVPHEQVGEVYNECDVLVMPSYNEGGPRVTLEAMACGTPVLTTNIGIMKEVIRDGENGLFITWQPADIAGKILRVLRDDNLRARLAEAGQASVQGFEYKRMIQNYAQTYQRLVKSQRA
jgi:glycosyltransferase involved in cell wall biosynthesis